jgi:hypothetical protein
MNMLEVIKMIKGNLMPWPPCILVSLVAITFMGHGELPKSWLKYMFHIHQQVVFEALQWLKEDNLKYYGDIQIDPDQLVVLPNDDIPMEIIATACQEENGLIAH